MVNREEIFKICKSKYYDKYDEKIVWDIVNIVSDEVELEMIKGKQHEFDK